MPVTSKDVTRRKKEAPPEVKEMFMPHEDETINEVKTLESDTTDDRVLMKMDRGCQSWTTGEGVKFLKDHPFQLVSKDESELLIQEGGFRPAHASEVKRWYNPDPNENDRY